MTADPILEELCRVKAELAKEAGHDVRRLCDNTRRWAALHPPSGPLIHSAKELAQYVEQRERHLAGGSATQT